MLEKPETCKGCPLYEGPYGKHQGFSVPTGTGKNGVMIVAEALGKEEEIEGIPLVGKSGYSLFQQLKRVDIDRDDFTVFNTIACRPPDNKLVGQPYYAEAVKHCAPNLDAAIETARSVAKAEGKTFVILTLGVTPFKRILDLDNKKIEAAKIFKAKHYYAYPFWSDTYGAWVLACPHPAYLMRGQTHLWPVIQFTFKRALEIADKGLTLDTGKDYLLDPSTSIFEKYVDDYIETLKDNPDNPLSYDIETPYKSKMKDEDEISKEDGDVPDDHRILRIGFSYYRDGSTHTTSVAWSTEYMAGIERLFETAPFILGWNSDKYDFPRVKRYINNIKGVGLDGMVAWHILNTSLPKALGFVTPYYVQDVAMWKHLSDDDPSFYNAKDADMALRNYLGIKADLVKHKLWPVYERHWIELHKALKYMTGIGVLRDEDKRNKAEEELSGLLETIETNMEAAVPDEAREVKIYKKAPKDLQGAFELVKDYEVNYCGTCGIQNPKRWKKHTNLCGGPEVKLPEPQVVWGKYKEFKVSKKRLISYQQFLKHQAIRDRKEKKVTFDADAITMLVKKYPEDKLYPTILEHRKVQKLLSTYIGYTVYKEVEVPDDYILQPGESIVNQEAN